MPFPCSPDAVKARWRDLIAMWGDGGLVDERSDPTREAPRGVDMELAKPSGLAEVPPPTPLPVGRRRSLRKIIERR